MFVLSCGCESKYMGFPSQWDFTDEIGNPAMCYGQLCEKHFYEYDAEPAQWKNECPHGVNDDACKECYQEEMKKL